MKPRSRKRQTTPPLPPLQHGDHMTQAEFHRRYEAYPEDMKFELIGGTVCMVCGSTKSAGWVPRKRRAR